MRASQRNAQNQRCIMTRKRVVAREFQYSTYLSSSVGRKCTSWKWHIWGVVKNGDSFITQQKLHMEGIFEIKATGIGTSMGLLETHDEKDVAKYINEDKDDENPFSSITIQHFKRPKLKEKMCRKKEKQESIKTKQTLVPQLYKIK